MRAEQTVERCRADGDHRHVRECCEPEPRARGEGRREHAEGIQQRDCDPGHAEGGRRDLVPTRGRCEGNCGIGIGLKRDADSPLGVECDADGSVIGTEGGLQRRARVSRFIVEQQVHHRQRHAVADVRRDRHLSLDPTAGAGKATQARGQCQRRWQGACCGDGMQQVGGAADVIARQALNRVCCLLCGRGA